MGPSHDPFVVALMRRHEDEAARVGRIVFRWCDLTLMIYMDTGGSVELKLADDEVAILRSRIISEGIEFVDCVARQLLRYAEGEKVVIERADIGDEEDLPEHVRCTTSWFPKKREG